MSRSLTILSIVAYKLLHKSMLKTQDSVKAFVGVGDLPPKLCQLLEIRSFQVAGMFAT